MPEQSAAVRAQGGGAWPREQPARLYTPDLLGGYCRECRIPMPATINDNMHPTCDPEWADLVALSRNAERRQPQPKGTTP